MCLGVPGQIVDVYQKDGLRMSHVDFSGVRREVCLDYIPEARVGDFCIVHVGFAITLLSQAEAEETLALLREISNVDAQLGPTSSSAI